ncbi:hypothetical protein LTR66_016769, partial [Elasticomyces elasticus]
MSATIAAKPTGAGTKSKKANVNIQTNGSTTRPSVPSSSPSSATKRLPGSTQPQATPATAISTTNGAARQVRRQPRVNTRVGTSGQLNGDRKVSIPPEPYVISEKHVLRKWKATDKPPSLVVHLYQTYFRFDNQEGSFGYQSELKFFMEHLRKRIIPHDMMEDLRAGEVKFHDGCLVVKVVNHRSGTSTSNMPGSSGDDDKPCSIHNHNHFITPSPYGAYPAAEKQAASSPTLKKEDLNGAGTTGPTGVKKIKTEASTSLVALRPTAMSRNEDLMLDFIAIDPKSRRQGTKVPQTPGGGAPQTPFLDKPPPLKKQ